MIWDGIQADLKSLSEEVSEMRRLGNEYAGADAAYRRAKALAILDERRRGTPATIARDVIYARQDVFDALVARDCADSLYEASRESINALKLRVRVNEAQLQREWSQSGQRGAY